MSTCPFNSIFLRTTNRSFCHFLCYILQNASNQIINNRKLKRNCGSVNRPRPIACVISSLIKVKSSHSKIISYIKFWLESEFGGHLYRRFARSTSVEKIYVLVRSFKFFKFVCAYTSASLQHISGCSDVDDRLHVSDEKSFVFFILLIN